MQHGGRLRNHSRRQAGHKVITFAVVIEYIKDTKVQSWLERCLWGKGSSTRYQNADEEMSELRIATAG